MGTTETAVSDLRTARLGFCLKNVIFVSKNGSELFGSMQKLFHVCLLTRVRIIAEMTLGQTVRSKRMHDKLRIQQ